MQGEKFTYELCYNEKGILFSKKPAVTVKDIPSYLERMSMHLDLSGWFKPISKETFVSRLERIPMLANLMRVETFY